MEGNQEPFFAALFVKILHQSNSVLNNLIHCVLNRCVLYICYMFAIATGASHQ